MSNTELEDEVKAITSIYTPTTLKPVLPQTPSLYALTFPSQPSISIQIEFPPDYPNCPPSISGTHSTGANAGKGSGNILVEIARNVLSEIYTSGIPCIFDLIEEVNARLQDLGMDATPQTATQKQEQEHGQEPTDSIDDTMANPDTQQQQRLATMGDEEPPTWTQSPVVTEKKSTFLARASPATSPSQARAYLTHLLATDKKASRATHNISAWRIRGPDGVQFQDCDDDGETAAGARVLHLMEVMGVWDVVVVVSRWYGGVKLGADRFRIINQVARQALVAGGFAKDGSEGGNKSGGRK